MIHLSKAQYEDLRTFSHMVREDLMKKSLKKSISENTLLIGQNYGFCKEEITEIVEDCYNDLVRLVHK